MDGTLLKSDGTMSARTREGLKQLYASGVSVSVATSRSYSALDALGDAHLHAPLILLGGARIYDMNEKRVLREHVLPRREAEFALEAVRAAGLSPLIYTQSGQDEQLIYYENGADAALHAYVDRMRLHYGDGRFRGVDALEEVLDEKLFFVTARGGERELPPLLEHFAGREVHAYLYSAVRLKGTQTIEISPVSKAVGVRELRELTGAERIVVFGDNGNDQGLFEAADERIAVGNATDDLKRLADRIIGTNDEDAVIREILSAENLL